jgi:plastocyanin
MECASVHGCSGNGSTRLVSTILHTVLGLTNRIKISGFLSLFCSLMGTGMVDAGELAVHVAGADGKPVPDVVVFITQQGVVTAEDAVPTPAIMDQRDVRFAPHILVVEKGATVEFPNSDVVAHHVYSFSRPNNFVLPLYKGTSPEPVTMTHDGVVTLGCNIHDGMLGYVVVVDTRNFGKTDKSGDLSLAVDAGASSYTVSIWSPRIRDSKEALVQTFTSPPSDGVTFALQKSLRPAHVEQSDAVAWDDYE